MAPSLFSWSKQHLKVAMQVLRKTPMSRYREALPEIARRLGIPEVTPAALRSAFLRNKLGPPSAHCDGNEAKPPSWCTPKPKEEPLQSRPGGAQDEQVRRLFDLVRGKKVPTSLVEIANRMDLSPQKAKVVIDRARAQGLQIHFEHDHVALKQPSPSDRVVTVGVPPTVGDTFRCGALSDTHLGSKYCLREQLKDFVAHAYSLGVREIMHAGDVLDGAYRHGVFEVSHTGLDAQAQDLFETLPQLPGLNYRFICGNHDFTFSEQVGVSVGDFLVNYFKERGRNDLHFYGDRSAFLRIGGVVVHLWHPRSGVGYAKSYQPQRLASKYAAGEKPHITLIGHWHVFNYTTERGIHLVSCPTMQGGGSAFSRSLGGAPDIGGLILSWRITEHGTIRRFTVEHSPYYEVEQPREVELPPGVVIPVSRAA